MALFSGFAYASYFIIVVLAIIKVFADYEMRQLVKANFWLNVAIFAMIALLTLLIMNEILLD
jgi:uncharacterized protein (DUF983 family)